MKALILFVSLFMFVTLNAQDFGKVGQWEFAGNASFTMETNVFDGETDDNSTNTFTLEPMFGYFVYDGVELGFMPMFQSQTYDESSITTWAFYAVPQYVFDLKGNAYPYLGVFLGYNSTNIDYGEGDATLSGFSYGGVGGVKVVVTKHALLNFGLQYLLFNMEPEDWDGGRVGMNQFGITAGFSIFLN